MSLDKAGRSSLEGYRRDKGKEMENRNLLILGAGQHGNTVKEIADALHWFEKIDFLDDVEMGACGKLLDYESYAAQYRFGFPAFGNPSLRREWMTKLKEACYIIPCLIHKTASISPSAQVQEGVLVGPMAVVNTNSVLCPGTIVSAGACVDHDCLIGDYCHIDCGAVVPSNSLMPAETKIPAGQIYKIGKESGK